MRSAFLASVAAVLLASVGCHHNLAHHGSKTCHSGCQHGGSSTGYACSTCEGGCEQCGSGGGSYAPGYNSFSRRPTRVARLPYGYLDQQQPAGPPSAAYAYPYYTVRAPRDFLLENPHSIGY